jgi:hypothetical protein
MHPTLALARLMTRQPSHGGGGDPCWYEHSKVDNQHPIRHNSFICSRCKMPGQYDELVGGSRGMLLRPRRRGIGMSALLKSTSWP